MYACELNVVTSLKVVPNCVPTSVVVEKPTGEFGVKVVATGKASLVLLLVPMRSLPVASCVISPGD